MESRVGRNTERLLDLFDEFGVHGDVLRPRLGRRTRSAARARHRASRPRGRVARLRPSPRLRPDARRLSRGRPPSQAACSRTPPARAVGGYRAPSFSVTPRSLWALDVLIEEGSLVRRQHLSDPARSLRHSGLAALTRIASTRPSGSLVEVPGSTVRLGPLNLPIGRRRLFPDPAVCLDALGHRSSQPPRTASGHVLPASVGNRSRSAATSRRAGSGRFRHYRNLHKTEAPAAIACSRTSSFGPLGTLLTDVASRSRRPMKLAPVGLPYVW